MTVCGAIDPASGAVCTELACHGLRHHDRSVPSCVVSWGEEGVTMVAAKTADESVMRPR